MSNKNKVSRDINTEYFRVFACLSIVLLHLNAWCFSMGKLSPNVKTVSVFINTMTRFAVPGFMLITGTYIFENAKKNQWLFFYKKTVKKIILPTIFFSGVCVVYKVLKEMLKKRWVLVSALQGCLRGTPMGHMWYMYMLIGFYIAVPVLWWLRHKIDRRVWGIMGILCIVLSQIFYKGDLLAPLWPFSWIQYVGYFILGDTLRKIQKQPRIVPFTTGVSVISGIGMLVYSLHKIHMGIRFDFQPQNILTAVFSVSLYLTFRNMKEIRTTAFQQKIAKQSANIYFIHGIFINIMKKVLNRFPVQYANPILFLLIGFIVVTTVSYGIGCALKIFNK